MLPHLPYGPHYCRVQALHDFLMYLSSPSEIGNCYHHPHFIDGELRHREPK